jgi:hypothetical protein
MRSNVGGIDRLARSVLGPVLVVLGWRALEGRQRGAAVAALIGGTLLTETAVTATCPVNRALRLDSRARRQLASVRGLGEGWLAMSERRGYDATAAAMSRLGTEPAPTAAATGPAVTRTTQSRPED